MTQSDPPYLSTGDAKGAREFPAGERAWRPVPPEPPAPASAPRLGGTRVALLLALVVLLQVFALTRVEGYRLADSVEYMDRAQDFVSGVPLDETTVRSFAFSAVLAPAFWIASVLGLEDQRIVVLATRLVQMALGLLAVLSTIRVGARLAGPRAGLAAGLVLGANPIFLQYTIEPLSATAAMLCVIRMFETLLDPPDVKRGLRAGLWAGVGLLMAFQVIPIVGLAMLLEALRGRLRRWKPLFAMSAGIAAFVALQVLLDKLVYGSYGSSLFSYVVGNVLGILSRRIYQAGFHDLGMRLYELTLTASEQIDEELRQAEGLRQLDDPLFYVKHLPRECLAWPVIGLLALGALAALRMRRFTTGLVLLQVVVNVYLMSSKGSKSFRLWMPLLPFVALLCGLGWQAVAGSEKRGARRVLAALWLASAVVLGARIVWHTNLAQFGGYWQAMELVDAAAARHAASGAEQRVRVASAYHWAVRFRDSPAVELVKLPHQIDRFPRMSEAEQTAVLAELETLDWFIGHGQVITQDPRVMEVLNRRLEIAAVLYDRETFEDLAPIYVLRPRGSGAPGEPVRTFFDVLEEQDQDAYRARIEHPTDLAFRRRQEDGSVLGLVLLGFDVETGLSGGRHAWITYHWLAGELGGHDYTVVDRVTFGEHGVWQNNHRPTSGVHPTSAWRAGAIVREGFLIDLPDDPLAAGGPYCRGDLVPARLWMAVSERDAADNPIGGLSPFRPSGAAPYSRVRGPTGIESHEGRVWSNDGLILVGGFWVPVPPGARVPDDGRPLADHAPAR